MAASFAPNVAATVRTRNGIVTGAQGGGDNGTGGRPDMPHWRHAVLGVPDHLAVAGRAGVLHGRRLRQRGVADLRAPVPAWKHCRNGSGSPAPWTDVASVTP